MKTLKTPALNPITPKTDNHFAVKLQRERQLIIGSAMLVLLAVATLCLLLNPNWGN